MKRFLLLMLIALCACEIGAQPLRQRDKGDLRLMFFNLENYFAPFVDSLHPEREFSPASMRRWTWNRFVQKTNGIYKIIVSVGEMAPPELIGFCEVENRFVLNHLYYQTPLAKYDYGIVHQDSPDSRGIDVALFYLKSAFTLVNKKFIPVRLENGRTTRDILYAKGIVNELDTLHVMVVHAPSKYGGAVASEGSRGIFAATLRHFIDSLQSVTHKLNLVVVGDFNDSPDSPSVSEGLQASSNLQGSAPDSLYNLAMPYHQQGKGSIKFQGAWELIDLVLVSGNLLNKEEPLYCLPNDYRIFEAPFLMEPDEQYTGEIPHRTYKGMRYNGGISDHLPVVLDIRKGF